MPRTAAIVLITLAMTLAAVLAVRTLDSQIQPRLVSAERVVPKPIKGLAFTSYSPDGYSRAADALTRLKALGGTDAQLVPRWTMASKTSNVVERDGQSASDSALATAIRAAKERGLRVMVKPHIDVRDGTYRGQIEPSDWSAWWSSYRDFILREARTAALEGADLFCVGTELATMERDVRRWRSLIEDVREVFRGPLTYAVNWDQPTRVRFWDDLDLIGVDAYFPVDADRLQQTWRPIREELAKLSRRYQRPVAFTEVGYPSAEGADERPYEVGGSRPVDQAGQEKLYRGAFQAFERAPWFSGMWWWDWRGDGQPASPNGFEPTGKAAEDALRDYWGGRREDDPAPGVDGAGATS